MRKFRKLMPYGMRKTDRGTWIVFNRDYAEIGELKMRAGPATLARLSVNGEAGNQIWFYDDASLPDSGKAKDDYLAKLALLMTMG